MARLCTLVAMSPEPNPQGPDRIPFLRSMRARLAITLTLFVALTALVLSVADYGVVRSVLQDSVEQQLKLRAQGLSEVLLAHVRQQQERVLLVASRTRLRALLDEHLEQEIADEPFRAETARILSDALESTEGFRAIRVADADGLVITATEPALVGSDVGAEPAFLDGLERATLGLPTAAQGGFEALLSAPARTNDGRLLGVVLVDVDADPMRSLLTAIPSKFVSAEVRVAADLDGDVRYLFRAASASERAGGDPPMRAALAGDAGFVSVADFRGRDVLAAYDGVGYRGWGLVTQVDVDEAYAPIARLLSVLAAAGVLVALVGLVVSIRVAGRFTRPVLALAQIAQRVGEGDLDARATTDRRDEIGALGRAFNTMNEALQEHRDHLQELVHERTQGLELRTTQLQRSHNQLADLCRLLEGQAEVMERDLTRAELIQRSLLPSEPPSLRGFCVQALYRPGRNIGGDLYDVIKVGDRYLVLVVADASGHGVSAALLAVLFKHRLRVVDEATGGPLRPADALSRLNKALCAEIIAPGVFFTCVYGLLDVETRELVVASGGHPAVVCARHAGGVDHVAHTGPALGLSSDAEFTEQRLRLERRDRVLLYTDGLFDVSDGGPPDVAALAEMLRSSAALSGALEKVLIEVSGGREREDRDDVTMLLLEAQPGESRYHDSTEDIELTVDTELPVAELSYASSGSTRFICINGRVTWTHGQSLLDAVASFIERELDIVIDLSGCHYLDSTMLGTLHEVTRRVEQAGGSIALQNVSPQVRASFEELSMGRVLDHVGAAAQPVPEPREPLEVQQTDLHRQRKRLLEAHEELAALSPENQAQFGRVVDALRGEVEEG